MPRKESEVVPEGDGPVPQQEEFGSGEPCSDLPSTCRWITGIV